MPVINANSVDPDQMPHSAASDLGLHCLPMSHLWVKYSKNSFEKPTKSNCQHYKKYLQTKSLVCKRGVLSVFLFTNSCKRFLFVCFEVLRPSQPNGVMSSAVSLPNHTFTGQA